MKRLLVVLLALSLLPAYGLTRKNGVSPSAGGGDTGGSERLVVLVTDDSTGIIDPWGVVGVRGGPWHPSVVSDPGGYWTPGTGINDSYFTAAVEGFYEIHMGWESTAYMSAGFNVFGLAIAPAGTFNWVFRPMANSAVTGGGQVGGSYPIYLLAGERFQFGSAGYGEPADVSVHHTSSAPIEIWLRQ